MPADIVATVSIVIALAALAITLWQNRLTRRAMQAQVFLTLKQLADAVPYDEGLDVIATLNDYSTYEDYLATEPEERRQLINNTIKFLNYAAHLANKKYLPRQHIWDLYFWGYRIARQKRPTRHPAPYNPQGLIAFDPTVQFNRSYVMRHGQSPTRRRRFYRPAVLDLRIAAPRRCACGFVL